MIYAFYPTMFFQLDVFGKPLSLLSRTLEIPENADDIHDINSFRFNSKFSCMMLSVFVCVDYDLHDYTVGAQIHPFSKKKIFNQLIDVYSCSDKFVLTINIVQA